MSPTAYEVESVTAAAPMIEALRRTMAKMGPVAVADVAFETLCDPLRRW